MDVNFAFIDHILRASVLLVIALVIKYRCLFLDVIEVIPSFIVLSLFRQWVLTALQRFINQDIVWWTIEFILSSYV